MPFQTRIEGLGRYLETLDSDVSSEQGLITQPYNPIKWTEGEIKTIALKLSENEFVRICSALMNGSALTYPENPDAAWFAFIRNYEYPEPMIDCETLAELIENCEIVQEKIAEVGLGGGSGFEPALNRKALGKFDDVISYKDNTGECLPDNLFGAVSQMISLLDSNNRDFFEIIEISLNRVEFIQVVATITGIDEGTVFDTVSAFISFSQDNFKENYEASYTDELYDSMRCEVFCIAQADCELSLDTFWNWINDKMAAFPLSSLTLNDILETFVLGEYIDEFTVYAFYWLQLAVLKGVDTIVSKLLGGEFSGDAGRLIIQLLTFSNDPDPDWLILCDDCEDPFNWRLELTTGNDAIVTQIAPNTWAIEMTSAGGSGDYGYQGIIWAYFNDTRELQQNTLAFSATGWNGTFAAWYDPLQFGQLGQLPAGAISGIELYWNSAQSAPIITVTISNRNRFGGIVRI